MSEFRKKPVVIDAIRCKDALDGTAINPSWAEGYMGYPIGWTVVTRSETPSSLKSPNSSAAPSSKRKALKP